MRTKTTTKNISRHHHHLLCTRQPLHWGGQGARRYWRGRDSTKTRWWVPHAHPQTRPNSMRNGKRTGGSQMVNSWSGPMDPPVYPSSRHPLASGMFGAMPPPLPGIAGTLMTSPDVSFRSHPIRCTNPRIQGQTKGQGPILKPAAESQDLCLYHRKRN